MSLAIARSSASPSANGFALKPGLEPVVELMSRVLRDGRPLAPEYPLVFGEGFPGKVIRLGDDQDTYSTLGLLPREMVTPSGRFPVLLVGSVATDPAHQGKGLASRALEAAEEHARQIGAIAVLLWADQPGFYCTRGYRAVGAEIDISLTPALLPRLPQTSGVRELRTGDEYMVQAIQLASPIRSSRRLEETRALLAIPGSKTLVWERDGEVRAYASMGKGEDLTDVIHEWGGDSEGVLALARAHAERCLIDDPARGVFLISPDAPLESTQELIALGFPAQRGVLAMGKLANRERALARLSESVGVGLEAVREATADLSDHELLQCLLPARSESETAVEVAARLGVEPASLAFFGFLSGFDSI